MPDESKSPPAEIAGEKQMINHLPSITMPFWAYRKLLRPFLLLVISFGVFVFLCIVKLPVNFYQLPFLPYSWKWKIAHLETSHTSSKTPFSTSMIVGGRVTSEMDASPLIVSFSKKKRFACNFFGGFQ